MDIENINTVNELKKKATYGIETGAPPLVVVVQGGKGSGKSTLIKSLVKYYIGKNLKSVEGNITVRNSKNQRLTFIECNNDMNNLIDLSKVADICLLLIDASIGFELETFEYLCMLKNHGYTSVIGVMTHMDNFKQNKSLSRLKKQIKKRFQKEATDKAKLFYLYGMQNDLYPKLQMHNLARYLRVVKPENLPFRQKYPYLICDKFITYYNNNNNSNSLADNKNLNSIEDLYTVSFFGYIRGNHFNINSNVYIIGLEDYSIDSIKIIEDPCPYQTVEVSGLVKRTLKQKEKVLFAPWSNVNNIEFDRKEGYISIPEKFIVFTKQLNEQKNILLDKGVQMVRQLQSDNITSKEDHELDYNNDTELKLKNNLDESVESDDDIDIIKGIKLNKSENNTKSKSNDNYLNPHVKLNKILNEYKKDNYILNDNSNIKTNILKEIYGEFDDEPIIKTVKREQDLKSYINFSKSNVNLNISINNSYEISKNNYSCKYSSKFIIKEVKRAFITSNYVENEDNYEEYKENSSEEEHYNTNKDDLKNFNLNIEGNKINLKDLENDSIVYNKDTHTNLKNEIDKKNKNKKINEFFNNNENELEEIENYNNKIGTEKDLEDNIFIPENGYYKLGKFVRIDIKNISGKYIKKFKPNKPIIICTTDVQEISLGYMKVKLEKHLYYPKILKSNDPLIYSIGWRRFQTTATLCLEDKHTRLRAIKYTPKFNNCLAISYGPIMPVYLRVVAFQNTSNKLQHFRICATGDLLENNNHFQVMKKLKLIGEAYKVEKKTAFIKGMFNSSLEVAKYIGAEIKTVSGIRGQIKKQENLGSLKNKAVQNKKNMSFKKHDDLIENPVNNNNNKLDENFIDDAEGGCFRATFEDRILKSDIIYLRTWHEISLTPYYNSLTDYEE